MSLLRELYYGEPRMFESLRLTSHASEKVNDQIDEEMRHWEHELSSENFARLKELEQLFTRDDDELHAECFRAGAAFGILLMQDALEAQKQFMPE